ncbi:hypothetical protein [Maioricimonas rarisocia]|nr:hypothetical protein [Maioricimonas rarisocia]
MASRCRREAASLIQHEARTFCDREPPVSQEALERRQQQALFLTSRIGSICHADLMARNHPEVSDEIIAAVREFLSRVRMDQSPHKESVSLISRISTICNAGMVQRP